MSKTPSTATLIGKAIGALIQNGITFWAAVSTSGLVHGVLIGYVAFNTIVFIAYGTIAIAKSEAPKRPVYGDVYVSGVSDSRR